MTTDRIKPMAIEQEMKNSFLDYSMSVIVSRALPDVRDGLKPVHRRILFAMHELGLHKNRSFRKSALIVGETMGKYHPHGDSAIYDTLVRMAQPWNLRYPLVDGQGNFGSIDGDSAAAMRYTESRMESITGLMLGGIEKETVDMTDNYDGSLHEPTVMPSAIPNLLVNGSYGIAVGMATSCPPHNLTEVCDAVVHLIDNPECTPADLMKFVKGPDFPTGGVILGRAGIRDAYMTGRGRVTLRAKVAVEKRKDGKLERLIIQEIPYQLNKTKLIEDIANLVRTKTIESSLLPEPFKNLCAGSRSQNVDTRHVKLCFIDKIKNCCRRINGIAVKAVNEASVKAYSCVSDGYNGPHQFTCPVLIFFVRGATFCLNALYTNKKCLAPGIGEGFKQLMLLSKGCGGLPEPANLQWSEFSKEFKCINGVGIDGVIHKKEYSAVILLKPRNFTDDIGDCASAKRMAVEEMYIAEVAAILAPSSSLDQVGGKVSAFDERCFTDRP